MGVLEGNEAWSTVLADLPTQTEPVYDPYGPTARNTRLLALLQDAQPVSEAIAGDKVEVVLAETPFYVEAGGQVSDRGTIRGDGWLIEIENMRRPVSGLVVHVGEVIEGRPRSGDSARAEVDVTRRNDVIRNHSATHLLHAALRQRLGNHVQQRGSLVAPERLRFDFAHDARPADEEIRQVEREVNEAILADYCVEAVTMPLTQARAEGAMALFGEKYSEEVRTIRIGEGDERYSYELCGGLHVRSTQAIGQLRIIAEGSVSAGVRRIEALTGRAAQAHVQQALGQLDGLAAQLGGGAAEARARLNALQQQLSTSRREVATLRREIARHEFAQRLAKIEQIGELPLLVTQLDGQPMESLREMADLFRQQVPDGVLVLGSVVEGRPLLMVSVGDGRIKQGLHAGQLIRPLAARVGGGGGGRPALAQAGGRDAAALPEALASARALIADHWQPA